MWLRKRKIVFLLIVFAGLSFFVLEKPIQLPNQIEKTKAVKSKTPPVSADKEEAYEFKLFKEIPEQVVKRISGGSFKEGGPVSLAELSYIQVSYWGFDDKKHQGELIIHQSLAEEVSMIFKELYEAKFPIERMRLIDEYQADDNLSMANNNTSAFCVRKITGELEGYSKHSYGFAIDINPLQNPFVKRGGVLPEEGKAYLDRQSVRKGMIIKGDQVYQAFSKRGWRWGGDWLTIKDYQHFEKNIY